MKKSILMTGAALIMALSLGCNRADPPQTTAGSTTTTAVAGLPYSKTLNGVDEDVAAKMRVYYKQGMSEAKPEVLNYFLSKEMLTKIVAVLEDEAKITAADEPVTDGVRFYFGKETSKTDKTTLLLVATREFKSGTNLDKTHEDYYDYQSKLADDLFKDLTKLQIKPEPATLADAELYKPCTPETCRELTCTPHTNYIPRLEAYNMLTRFNNKPVNTKAVWFSTALLKELISDQRCDGIRVYVGRHKPLHSKYPDKVTLILSQTEEISPGHHRDYFTCSTYEAFYKDSKDKNKSKFFDPYDNGELCPNNCD